MAFPNVSDIIATTIESRTRKIADNVTDNNALLKKLSMSGRIKTFSGGTKIYQELSFQENQNAGFYSGYDLLPVAASDVLSAAEFEIKQAAVPVVISGLEQLQNSGKEKMIDLMESRMTVAEATMANLICTSLYSDGTGYGGKEITGLDLAVPLDPTTGTYGGINRATWNFWRSQLKDVGDTTTLQADMNSLWASLIRGTDRPDQIIMDDTVWEAYVASLQAQQRFQQADVGDLGFPTLKFMGTDVCLDGGIGGSCPAGTAFFLNTKYIHYRPHRDRNMVPLSPNRRYATNQDAEVQILAWAGNLTMSGSQFQGRLDVNA
ncbi:MAG: phage major capsid protein [Thioalkalivibrio sp.]|nr:phage major capsid protein [Thioalkalivibrio sp.]